MSESDRVVGPCLARVVLAVGTILFSSLFLHALAGAKSEMRLYSLYEVTPVDRMPPAMRRAYRRAIVTKLAELGYLAPDTAWDAGTASVGRAAVLAYQHDAGLPADGVMSRELLDHMVFVRPETRAGQKRMKSVTLAPTAPPLRLEPEIQLRPPKLKHYQLPSRSAATRPPRDDVITVEPLPPARARGYADSGAGTVSRGGGGFVSRIQRELKALGYYEGSIDGVYGDSTASAVRRFQKDKGLPVTGAIDARLLNALSLG